jgi:hypothetical protein
MIRHEPAGTDRAEPVATEPSETASARPTSAEPVPQRPSKTTADGHAAPEADDVGNPGQNGSVDLARLAWLVTVLACLITIAILTLQGYYGYALVTLAVAVSAGINLT